MPTCAIYARVSDDTQARGESISHQVGFCREIARRRSVETSSDWCTPADLVYVDEGISGTSLVHRSEVKRLVRDAREGRFDVVLFKGISRFARDTVDALLMLRTLLASNVRVISIEENFDSRRDSAEFVFTIHSALAQAESEKTAVRVRLGAVEKARRGKWNGAPPDGYALDAATQRLVIDPSFAPVIREVFALYLGGYGTRAIADKLNRSGLLTKRGCLWTQRTISRLLCNPAYVGDVVYGRREKRLTLASEDQPSTPKKKTVWAEDPQNVVVCAAAHPSIIDRETFQHAAQIRQQRTIAQGQTGRLHLLTKGLLRCRCGSNMTIKYNGRGTAYYRCLRRHDQGTVACTQRYLRADEVEAAVVARVRADATRLLPLAQLRLPVPQLESSMRQCKQLQQRRRSLMHQSQLLLSQFANGTISEDQFAGLNRILRRQIADLRRSEEALNHAEASPSEQELVQPGVVATKALDTLLRLPLYNARATRQLLLCLITHVQVERDGVRIHYRCGGSSADHV